MTKFCGGMKAAAGRGKEMFDDKVFIHDECNESLKELFEREVRGCTVEDDCIVILNGVE